MDLRTRIRDPHLLERAKQLVIRGLLNYQPWIFSESLETGVGWEWSRQALVGLVYFPDIPDCYLHSPELRRLLIDHAGYDEFHEANARLRLLYDGIVDELCMILGDISTLSFLDVGCNTGYLPQSFALRGALEAAGCDREKGFADTFALMNDILGTHVKFRDAHYEPKERAIRGVDPHDIVLSMAVLCHQAEPLSHLAALTSVAKKGLFVWTLINDDADCTIHFGEPRGEYKEDVFPLCFDHDITLSESLLRKSLTRLGFARINEVPLPAAGLPRFAWRGVALRGFLAIR